MTHDAHNIIPDAVAEYCEAVRQSRIAEIIRARQSAFESVVVSACRAPVVPVDNKPLDIIIEDAIRRALSECGGNILKAAQKLGVTRGMIYKRLRKAVAA